MYAMPEVLSRSDEPFRYVAGDPSLDLVNTVDWTDRGLEHERLTDYERLVSWAEGAAVVPARQAAALRRRAGQRTGEAAAALDTARSLRWALQRVFAAVARDGELADAEAVAELNDWLARSFRHLRLTPDRSEGEAVARWSWRGEAEVLESVLWPVAGAAASLLTSEEARSIRICGGDACGWLFVDRSRNRLRRWCQMETCGTREKSRRRLERRRGHRSEDDGGHR